MRICMPDGRSTVGVWTGTAPICAGLQYRPVEMFGGHNNINGDNYILSTGAWTEGAARLACRQLNLGHFGKRYQKYICFGTLS